MRKTKRVWIKTRMTRTIIIIFLFLILVTSVISGAAAFYAANMTMKTTLDETAKQASSNVAHKIQNYKTLLTEMATAEVLTEETTDEEKLSFVNEKASFYRNEMGADLFYAKADGTVLGLGISILDREFYKNAIADKSMITNPIVRKDTGTLGYTYAVPVEKEGNVTGVLYMIIDYEMIYDIIKECLVGKNGFTYVIDKNGNTIIDSDQQKVIDSYNTADESESDSGKKAQAVLEQKACAGQNGFGSYQLYGKKYYMVSHGIENTDGWSLLINLKSSEFMYVVNYAVIISIFANVLLAFLAIISLGRITRQIAGPVNQMAGRMEKLSKGDLKTQIDKIDTNDEIEELYDSLLETMEFLQSYITNITEVTTKIAHKNLNLDITLDYIGDFSPIREAMQEILDTLNQDIKQINELAEGVFSSADGVASTSQVLSDGASVQTKAVEELSLSVKEIKQRINENHEISYSADKKMKFIEAEVLESSSKMKKMMDAMEEINHYSSEISSILEMIEDIASQTNLLSLNASIEAARAGESGKGFAVIAADVGKLAVQSQEASKNTAELIQESLRSIENGTLVAKEAEDSMVQVTSGTKDISDIIHKVSEISSNQEQSIVNLMDGIEEIVKVVEQNSAAAQEGTAISEELIERAGTLKEVAAQFELR